MPCLPAEHHPEGKRAGAIAAWLPATARQPGGPHTSVMPSGTRQDHGHGAGSRDRSTRRLQHARYLPVLPSA